MIFQARFPSPPHPPSPVRQPQPALPRALSLRQPRPEPLRAPSLRQPRPEPLRTSSLRRLRCWLAALPRTIHDVGLPLLLVGLLQGLAAAPAQAAQQLAPVAPRLPCSLNSFGDISLAEAPAQVTAVSTETVRGKPMCLIAGVISPQIRFIVRLPQQGWTQRYLQTGCGGLCGRLAIGSPQRDCSFEKDGSLAMASTDMGHVSGAGGIWAAADMQLRVDFGYRAVHVTSLIAKELIRRYYGQAPKFSYFSGCSDGGREALMAAQRYPEDFDGIAAGAPSLIFTVQNSMYHGWNARVVRPDSDRPTITEDDLPILHRRAVQQCDAADGTRDGLISDPTCTVDPHQWICPEPPDAAHASGASQAPGATGTTGPTNPSGPTAVTGSNTPTNPAAPTSPNSPNTPTSPANPPASGGHANAFTRPDERNCISARTADAVAEIYRGAHDGEHRLVPGSALPGSELAWLRVIVPRNAVLQRQTHQRSADDISTPLHPAPGPETPLHPARDLPRDASHPRQEGPALSRTPPAHAMVPLRSPAAGAGRSPGSDGEAAASAGTAIDQVVLPPSARTVSLKSSSDIIPALAYPGRFDPHWKLASFRFTRENLQKLAPMHALLDASNPDLSAFRKAGGKLLMWHGLSDPNITPMNAIGYWQAVRDTLHPEPLDGQDGPSNTDPRLDDLIRLFLIPGMYHCDRGEGLGSLDVTTPLMDWVEDGKAPETLDAAATEADADAGRIRPIHRFPYLTVLSPGGDPKRSRDWQRGRAIGIDPQLYRHWAGADFFQPGFQRFCGFSGLQFSCRP